MAKKEFTGAFDSVMNEEQPTTTTEATNKKKVGRPSLPNTYGRTSFIINQYQAAKVKAIAKKEGFPIKDIIEKALGDIIERYEQKHGVVVVELPQKKSIEDIF